MTKYMRHNSDGSVTDGFEREIEYDAKGNMLKATEHTVSGEMHYWIYEYYN